MNKHTGVLVMAGGKILFGKGFGAFGYATGEICFNTAMTGYQEILTDPSYNGQIITFTFPHIGNVGTNDEDNEAKVPFARGLIVAAQPTMPSSWRAQIGLNAWLIKHNIIGISGIDTRFLTQYIRDNGAFNVSIAHRSDGSFDQGSMIASTNSFPSLEGMDLAGRVSSKRVYEWQQSLWRPGKGYGECIDPSHHVVVVDYGVKRNILRHLSQCGLKVTVVPANMEAEAIIALRPDGVFLSNGPGDPAATGSYAIAIIKKLIDFGAPIFGICLGHQLLALAVGGKTAKMAYGHHGANHPVKNLSTGSVEITSQNHGFMVLADSLPANARQTHISLFDGTNQGFCLTDRPVFSVQYHPEGSPGPFDSHYLFSDFLTMIKRHAKTN